MGVRMLGHSAGEIGSAQRYAHSGSKDESAGERTRIGARLKLSQQSNRVLFREGGCAPRHHRLAVQNLVCRVSAIRVFDRTRVVEDVSLARVYGANVTESQPNAALQHTILARLTARARLIG
jgi:hypothetical protein